LKKWMKIYRSRVKNPPTAQVLSGGNHRSLQGRGTLPN
jgi:hypothetical protein